MQQILYTFCVLDWDNYADQKTGHGWTKTNRLILFEFRNSPLKLSLFLIIGPGDDIVRNKIYNKFSNIYKINKKLTNKWTAIKSFDMLNRSDYEDQDRELMGKKLKEKWENFMKINFKDIAQAIKIAFES